MEKASKHTSRTSEGYKDSLAPSTAPTFQDVKKVQANLMYNMHIYIIYMLL